MRVFFGAARVVRVAVRVFFGAARVVRVAVRVFFRVDRVVLVAAPVFRRADRGVRGLVHAAARRGSLGPHGEGDGAQAEAGEEGDEAVHGERSLCVGKEQRVCHTSSVASPPRTAWHVACSTSREMMQRKPVFDCLVLGAAGRDFHDFLTFFADNPQYRVRCFTAQQIPFIAERAFPHELAPSGYDEDIPIEPEERLEALIAEHDVDFVFMSYSDVAHEDVMHLASRVQASGASFCLLGPRHTQLEARVPVVAVTAVRTGCGKSPLSRLIAVHLRDRGLRTAVVRHPMPYGDLRAQRVQHFERVDDLERHHATIEEREEYQPYLELGVPLYAGVDYRAILEEAQRDADVILWDGGNNDRSFFVPDLHVVVTDALRPGHEVAYHPGEANLRSADVVVINKIDRADRAALDGMRARVRDLAPAHARVVETRLAVRLGDEAAVRGKRVVVVEDGPTITHGGMASGAGLVAARGAGAEVVDPRPFAVGTLREAFDAFPHIGPVLPALGYSEEQRRELTKTLIAAEPDVVLDASPARLERVLTLPMPVVGVTYELVQVSGPSLLGLVDEVLDARLAR